MTTDKGLWVWLPLNGTLENKGLVKSTITSNGVSWSNFGKIGKCFDNSDRKNRWILLQNAFPAHDTDHTVCFWVKSLPNIAASGDWGYIYTTSNANATNAAKCDIATNTTNGYNITDSCPVFTVTVNDRTQWNHITIVTTKTKVVVYVNGQYSNEQTRNATIASSATRHIAISRNSTGSGTAFNMRGSINDFRVYSYALSPQEIKELSRGKVGHYPCDINDCSKVLWSDPTQRTAEANSYLNYKVIQLQGGKMYTLRFQAKSSTAKNNNGMLLLQYCKTATSGRTDSYNTWVRVNTTTNYQFYETTFTTPSDHPYFMLGRRSDTNTAYGISTTIKNVIIMSPLAFLSDISGFGRHGNITGGITLSSDTKRYDKSLNFSTSDGRAYASIVQPIPNSPSAMTIAFWIKPDSASANSYRQCFSFNSGYHWLSINTENNKVWFYQGGTLYVRSSNGTLDSNWHHIAMVWNGSQYQFYIDGIADTTTCISAPNYTLNIVAPQISTFIIGNNYTGTSNNGRLFKDYLSDIRLYATALSADDVKELYSLGH